MWKASPSHWKLMMSSQLQLHRRGHRVPVEQPQDLQLPDLHRVARSDRHARRRWTASAGMGASATWSWHGWDPVLQTHTAGLKSFDVQTRVGSGGWRTVARKTTATSRALERPGVGPHVRDARPCPRQGGQRREVDAGSASCGCPDPVRTRRFVAVNLISDPIHGYIELTKRLTVRESAAAGLPDEDVAEQDLLDTAWVQRLRRISQLQSARWVFPTAEHSRFTHGLGVMHEAGVWARSLYPSSRPNWSRPGDAAPSEGLVVETLRVAGLLHDVGHGPFAHFFDDHVPRRVPRPRRPAPDAGKAPDPRGPVRADHRGRARAVDPRSPSRARVRAGARRVRRRRDDRPRVGRLPHLEAGHRRPDDASLAALAAAAPVGRLHGRQPRLRAARRVPDRCRDRSGRRRATPPLQLHLGAGASPSTSRGSARSRSS